MIKLQPIISKIGSHFVSTGLVLLEKVFYLLGTWCLI